MKARIVPFLMTLVCCFHLSSVMYGQTYTPKYIVAPSEYNCFIIPTATHKVYDVAGGLPSLVAGQPAVVTQVAGSLHHYCLLDDKGDCYCWGNNVDGQIGNGQTSTTNVPMYKVAVDSLGNPFGNIVQIMPGGSSFGYSTAALKGDGTVWIWGATGGGNRGNGYAGGKNTRPVQVNFPAGVIIKKIQINVLCIALDQNGNVWTWGANAGYAAPYLLAQNTYSPDPTRPKMISLPGKAIDITGSNLWNFALLENGQLWGWGYYSSYLGIGNSGFKAQAAAKIVPVLLNSELNLPHPIKQIVTSSAATYVILTDSTLWAWGDNACGAVGNGQILDYAKYTVNPSPSGGTPAPYNWDWGAGELLQQKPVQIAKGLHSFTNIWTSTADTYFCYAEDVNGQLYSWGRNKGAVLGNGVTASDQGALAAIYPNSWDVPWVTAVDPFAMKKATLATSPYCALSPLTSPCNAVANIIKSLSPPTVSAGPNQTIATSVATVNGTATPANGANIISYLWSQVSGPNTALIVLNTGIKAQIQGLQTGTYVFQLKVTDNYWRTSTSTVTINVNVGGNQPPKAVTNKKIAITLPTNSATLDGTASSDPDGTIASYSWIQDSGPAAATISTPGKSTTTVTGLVKGTYTFFLTVTDDKGAIGTAIDTVVVNPGAITPPTAGAGSAQTIQLPVNTVTLTGTAAGTGGATITSTTWTQTSGPSTSTIVSPTALSTKVNGLIAGTYVFTITAKDNNGQTASSTVTITVKAANVAPTVNAGGTKTIQLPTSTVTLTGTATGNSGATISSTAWTQSSGPVTATIAAASSLSTGISGLTTAGTYVFTLTAKDNNGLTGTSTATIIVNAASYVAPTVGAGNAQTIQLPVSSVTLTGTATGNGGATISTTTWTQQSGPNTAKIATAAGLSTGVSGLVAGTYVFELTAKDSHGLSGVASVTVTVKAANVPPTVGAGSSQTIQLPVSSVNLTGTATANGGATIASTTWTQQSGPNTAVIKSPSTLSTGVIGLAQGVYNFQLSVKDNNGLVSTSTVVVTVLAAASQPTQTPPTVGAGSNQTIQLPAALTLTGNANGNGGATIVSTTWAQFSGPTTASIASVSSLSTGVSGLAAGTYVFQLTAKDNNGLSSVAQVAITVLAVPPNKAPIANAGPNSTVQAPVDKYALDGSASYDPDGTIVSYSWVQTAGLGGVTVTSANTAKPSVYGLTKGQYQFELTVKDNAGATGKASVTITVNEALKTPVANAGRDTSIALPNTAALLDGSASTDPAGGALHYEWSQVSGPTTGNIVYANAAVSPVGSLISGLYVFRLKVTNTAGLWDTASVRVRLVDEGRNGTSGSVQVLAYPNPVQNILHLRFSGDQISGPVAIRVYDMKGSLMQTKQAQIGGSGQEVTMDLTTLQRGTYALQMVMPDQKIYYQMVVKQ